MANRFQGHQLVIENSAPNLGLGTRADLNAYETAANKEAGFPARLSATFPTADAKLNIEINETVYGDGAGKSLPAIKGSVPTILASTWINFQLQTTNGSTFNVVWPASTVGFFRRAGFTLLASGAIQVNFTPEAATLGAVANPGTIFAKGGIPLGWIN